MTTVLDLSLLTAVEAIRPTKTASVLPTGPPSLETGPKEEVGMVFLILDTRSARNKSVGWGKGNSGSANPCFLSGFSLTAAPGLS